MPNAQSTDIRTTRLPRSLLKGLIVSVIITITSLLLLSFIITYTPLNEAYADTAVVVITYIAIVAGGFSASKGTSGRGWLTGITSALMYIFMMWIVASVSRGSMQPGDNFVVNSLISLICGAFGGIVGINCGN